MTICEVMIKIITLFIVLQQERLPLEEAKLNCVKLRTCRPEAIIEEDVTAMYVDFLVCIEENTNSKLFLRPASII